MSNYVHYVIVYWFSEQSLSLWRKWKCLFLRKQITPNIKFLVFTVLFLSLNTKDVRCEVWRTRPLWCSGDNNDDDLIDGVNPSEIHFLEKTKWANNDYDDLKRGNIIPHIGRHLQIAYLPKYCVYVPKGTLSVSEI